MANLIPGFRVVSPTEMWLHDIKSSFSKIGWRIGKEPCQYSMSPKLSTGLITHTQEIREDWILNNVILFLETNMKHAKRKNLVQKLMMRTRRGYCEHQACRGINVYKKEFLIEQVKCIVTVSLLMKLTCCLCHLCSFQR